MNLDLTNDELKVILTDQKNALKTIHIGDVACSDYSTCPSFHFQSWNVEEVFIRQEIMEKVMKGVEYVL